MRFSWIDILISSETPSSGGIVHLLPQCDWDLSLESAKMQAELSSLVVQARKVIQLTPRTFILSP